MQELCLFPLLVINWLTPSIPSSFRGNRITAELNNMEVLNFSMLVTNDYRQDDMHVHALLTVYLANDCPSSAKKT